MGASDEGDPKSGDKDSHGRSAPGRDEKQSEKQAARQPDSGGPLGAPTDLPGPTSRPRTSLPA